MLHGIILSGIKACSVTPVSGYPVNLHWSPGIHSVYPEDEEEEVMEAIASFISNPIVAIIAIIIFVVHTYTNLYR